MNKTFDYIVVGGGSAGAVLASRLSARPASTVLLLEAGADTLPGREPAVVRDNYYTAFYEPRFFWPELRVHFGTEKNARRYEQARILGGGSSVNAMIALRGLPGDFEEWGVSGWSWEAVLPYYKKLENDLDFRNPWHGNDGPIPVRRHRREQWPGFCQAVARYLARKGWQFVPDMNGPVANGYCAVPMANTAAQRVSTAMAYLGAEVRKRPNLTILTDAHVEKILIEKNRATGVQVGEKVFSARETIVSAGALHSPAVLMRSGIGPRAQLESLGIEMKADLPGVGANLQDHPAVSIACHLKPDARQPDSLRAAANAGLRYDSGVPGCAASDMYVAIANKGAWHALGRQLGALVLCLYKPYSRGTLTLASKDPAVEPNVRFNMLSDERDLERMVRAVRLAAEIYASPELAEVANESFPTSFSERVRSLNALSRANGLRAAAGAIALDGPAPLRRWLLSNVVNPGVSLAELLADEKQLRAWLKQRATGFYHPVGTCSMGSVVDADCRVMGVEALRVIDASVMPVITRANTNLTTIMLAERMAERIAGAG
jgi:5-(hydroxymethyl)furfural/furfural oxidase